MFAAKTALFVLADGNEENAAVFIVVDVRKELIEFVYYCFFFLCRVSLRRDGVEITTNLIRRET